MKKNILKTSLILMTCLLASCSGSKPTPEPAVRLTKITVYDTVETYLTTDTFDTTNELAVYAFYSDGNSKELNKNEYTYSVINADTFDYVDSTEPFDVEGDYVVKVSYQNKKNSVNIIVENDSTLVPKEKTDYTVLLYLCGADLESKYHDATKNIEEILKVNLPDTVNFIIQTGGAKSWSRKYGISARRLTRYHIENQSLVKDKGLALASMGSEDTLASFLEYGLTYYPADKTGLILWNHGGGVDGVCYDENFQNDALTTSEVNNAFERVFDKLEQTTKLEWIGYDACLMAMEDVAEMNSKYFNYMVSAQENEPSGGWAYDKWLDDLAGNSKISTVSLLTEICDTYYEKCADYYNSEEGYQGFNDATLSVLDLSKMNAVKTAWEGMAGVLKTRITSPNEWRSFTSEIISSCHPFGYDASSDTGTDCFDMQDFVEAMNNSYTYYGIDVDSILTAVDTAVVYNKVGADSGDACGLSFFCGYYGYVYQSSYTESDTNFSNWRALNIKYGSFYGPY